MVRCDMVFDMDYGLTPYTPQNIKNMDQYELLKKRNLKFPMTKKMLDYYMSLGFDCFVIAFHQRMDGSIFIIPKILYTEENLINRTHYCLMDREDIRNMVNPHEYVDDLQGYFQNKYEKRCEEIFKRRMYSNPPNGING